MRYQIAPGGARSKRGLDLGQRVSDTRLLRGERDQNAPRLDAAPAGYQIAPGGARSKRFRPRCLTTRYQIAPGGARSKPANCRRFHQPDTRLLRGERDQNAAAQTSANHPDTRLLRGERDQNTGGALALTTAEIPDCSGGSEIKTRCSLVIPRDVLIPDCSGGSEIKTRASA